MGLDLDSGIPFEVDDVDTRPVALRQILVVDDTPANLVAAEAALAPLGRTVVTAHSGQEALARMLDQDFALVLLDVNMPDMDGFETAELIRSRQRTRHVPIIFITANDQEQATILRAYELGAVDFLFKPILGEVLRAKASVFVTLQERTEQLAHERLEREFDNRRRDYETEALRRERDRDREAKQQLTRLNEVLAQADRNKDSFLAILAHELRNPLAPLRTSIDLLKCAETPAVTPRMLDILDRQTSALTRLVEDLLDVSRIKADKIELRPETVDLKEIIDAAVMTSRPLLEGRHHELQITAPEHPVCVVADTLRLTQVVCNLLNNAARYTPQGGKIEVSYEIIDLTGRICVTDNGIGIPAELHDSVFQMFVQERVRSDGSGGLGLGLALSRRLVEMHGGRITFESAGRDQGTSFHFTIPLAGTPGTLATGRRTRDMEPLVVAPGATR
ncbi:hybrid sensor histidine kinase/response regulator [soil metagenome]